MKYITRFLILILVVMGAIIFWVVSDQAGSPPTPPSTVVPADADPEAVADYEPAQDLEVRPEDEIPARTACREFLLQSLDAPDAAEFEDLEAWPLRKRPEGTLEVRMSGRIQDNLGEMIDAQWQCVVLPAGSQMRLVSITILGAGDNDRATPESSGPDTADPDTSAWESLTGPSDDEPAPGAEDDEQPEESSDVLDPATGEDASDAAFPEPERQPDN